MATIPKWFRPQDADIAICGRIFNSRSLTPDLNILVLETGAPEAGLVLKNYQLGLERIQ